MHKEFGEDRSVVPQICSRTDNSIQIAMLILVFRSSTGGEQLTLSLKMKIVFLMDVLNVTKNNNKR